MSARLTEIYLVILLWLCGLVFASEARQSIDADLKSEVAKLSKQNEELFELIAELKKDRDQDRRLNKQLADELQTLKDRLSSHNRGDENGQISKRQGQLNTQWVAFTAVIQQKDITSIQPGQAIVFDSVISDMGAAYDATSGMFTAPIRGIYVFNMDVMVEPSHNEYLEFVKDGSHVMYNYVHAQGGLDDVSSSRTVALELNAGEKFWVRIAQSANHGSGTIHGNGFTSFSGFLLRIIE